MLCRLLGRCSRDNITASCPIITQLLSGMQVRQTLDLCSMEGVSGGSRVPGVSASAALAPGRCLNTADCKSDSLECNLDDAATIYTCSDSGVLSSTTQGTCVKTTCQVCRDCIAATQPFAIGQATVINASQIAEEWLSYCQRTNNLVVSAKCVEVATKIRTEGAIPGNLGKRAAGLCFALGQCNTSSCGSSLQLDRCTVQGLHSGMRVPGVSMNLSLGHCFNDNDCTLPADTCDKSAASKLCTCSDGQDTCSGDTVGSCSIAGRGCSDCQQCLGAVQQFVKWVLQDSKAVSTWVESCTTAKLGTSDACTAVKTSFSNDVNKFRRAGLLCQALQRCSQGLAASADCTLPGILLGAGGASSAQARLDFCSAEGVTGGSVIPGFSATKTLPTGKCQNDMQCGDANLRCDTSNTTDFCYCEGGSDLCLRVGDCVRTSCAVCNDCLDSANRLTETTRFLQDNTTVVAAFDKWCSTPSRQAWAPASKCSEIKSLVSSNINVAKRAGLLCQNLGACNPATLPATCKLASRIASASTTVLVKGGQLDKCTLEGVSDGDLPAGVRPTGFKPLGTCFNTTDCSTDFDCDTKDGKSICSCDAATGTDTCPTIGSCVMQSRKACEVCVQAMQLFPDIVLDETRANIVADKFRSFCAGTGRSLIVCDASASAVAESVAGNLGRRVGALCRSLAECPAQASGYEVAVAAGQARRSLDYCSIKGVTPVTQSLVHVHGELAERVASGVQSPGSCRTDDECTGAGKYCSMATQTRVCTCANSTGAVSCQMYGVCKDTPCQVCSDCVSGLQNYVGNTSDNSTTVATAFLATCKAQGNAPSTCERSAAYILSSNRGNLGRRAGALCSMLGKCVGSVLADATCKISVKPSMPGNLDLCSVEGVTGGSYSLPDVFTGAGLPSGVCTSNKDCAQAGNDWECNLGNATRVCRCSGGFDNCQPPPPTGFCQPKPPPLPVLTRCETCQRCLDTFNDTLSVGPTTSADSIATDFRAKCVDMGRPSTVCDKVDKAIRGSFKGNLGRRVGGICRLLGECDAALATNATCVLTAASKSGQLSECSREGVTMGEAVAGIGKQAGTCFGDSDCTDTSKPVCSSDITLQVCTCRAGQDSCDIMSTCQPRPAPAAPVIVLTTCQTCQACLWAMQSVVTTTNAMTDRFAIGDVAFEACKQHWKENPSSPNKDQACSQLRKDIRESAGGITGKRAGLMCSLMNQCWRAGALDSSCTIAANSSTVGTLDLCTVQGVSNATMVQGILATAGLAAGCESDFVCGKGSICNQDTTTSACTCSAGVDTCKQLGSCIKFCESTQAKKKLETANNQVVVCDPFLPNTCSGGLVCQASSAGVRLVCNDNTGIVPVQVGGVCLPAERKLLSARFSSDGLQITVTLNAAARLAAVSCSSMFTSTALGARAWCSATDRLLTVQLDGSSTIMPGDTLDLRVTQSVLVDKLQSDVPFTGSITVATCSECAAPVPTVTGPQVVAEACDTASTAATVFGASFTDLAGRDFKSLEWGQDLSAGSNPVLAAVVNEVNKGATVKARSLLSLPAATVALLNDGNYVLTVRVTNFLQLSATKKLSFSKVGPGTAPVISIVGGPTQSFKIADGVNLASALEPTSVCAGKTVTYKWESLDGWSGIPAGGYTLKNLVLPAPVPAEAGQAYKLRLTARFTGSTAAATADITLTAVGSPLSASLLGPSGDVMGDKDIVLDASKSVDPDDIKGASPLSFTWDCVREDFPKPCFAGTNMGNIKGSRWDINAGLLTGMEKVHTFTVVVSKGSGDAARTASHSLQIRPRDPSVPIPTGVLTRDCGGSCSARHAGVQPLSVSLKLEKQDAKLLGSSDKQVEITWSLHPPGPQALVVPASAAVASATRNAQVQLVIPRESLPNAAAVTVSVKLTVPGQQGEGSASLTVPLNTPPVVKSKLDVELQGSDRSFGKAAFRLSTAGIVDDDELTYEIFKGSEFVKRTKSSTHTFGVGELAEGNTTLWVHAYDPEGAVVRTSVDVYVAPKSKDFDVGEQIFAMDVQQAVGSNDPSMLATTGSLLGTLSDMSKGKSTGNSKGRMLLQDLAGDATDNGISDVVRVKVLQLLAALATSSASSVTDAATIRQISGSAYQLLRMQEDSQLTDRSLQAALSITADAITSAMQAGKGVDSVYASELLVMTARALQLSKTASGAGSSSAGRRLLAAPQGYTAFTANGASRSTLLDKLDALADLLDEHAGPGVGWVTAISEPMSVSVVKESGTRYRDYTVAVGQQTTSGTANQPADLNNAANAQVTFRAGLTPSDSSVPIWLQLVQDPAVLVSSTPAPTEADINAFKAAAWFNTLPRVAPPLLNLTVLTPAVRVKLPQLNGDDAALPCAAAEANATVDCRLVVKLPVVNTAYVDTSKLLLCLRIDVDGKLVAAASEQDGWQVYGNYSTDGTLRCSTSRQGTYIIAAVDPVDTTPPVVTPESPPLGDITACNSTTGLYSNGTACNTTANVTSPDSSTTPTNASLGGAGLNDTTGLNGTSGLGNTTGLNGTSGLDNTTGLNGTSGLDNTTGLNGTSGLGNTTGLNGTSGLGNTTGLNGTSGLGNTTGPNGTSGSGNTIGLNDTNATSPSPEPEASPSPQMVAALPSPSPQPLQGVQQAPASQLSGLLINLGVVQSCTGTYTPVGPGVEQPVSTDAAGRFTVASPVLATYTFVSLGTGSCVDAVARYSLAFPYTLVLPPLANAAISAISLLTVPARGDAGMQAKHGSMTEVVPAELWTDVYGMFGYTADPKVDFLALTGLTGSQFAAVQGHSAQAMSTFSALHSLMKGLLNATAPADVAAGVVQAVYNRVKATASTNAAQVLTTKADLQAVADAIYTASDLQASGPQRKLQTASTPSNLALLFEAVSQVVAGINQKLQALVEQAQQLEVSGDSSDALLKLHFSNSKLAAVQQEDVVTRISTMANKLAADPNYNPARDIADFSSGFTGDALQTLVDSKKVDESAISSLLRMFAVEPLPKPKPNLAWVAGPIVGGLAGLAVVAGVGWWLYTRRQRANVPTFDDGTDAAVTDAAVRVQRRASDKYRVPSTTEVQAPAAPRAGAQLPSSSP